MRSGVDDEAFATIMQDLCTAYIRPYTAEISRVFWESLKWAHLLDVRRMAAKHRDNSKKFPTPSDLMPERATAKAPRPQVEDRPQMSSWAIAANGILLSLAYSDPRRKLKPIAIYAPIPERGYGLPLRLPEPLDARPLQKVLKVKADYVRMAEEAEAAGDTWDTTDFNRMCREGFEKLLGIE